SADIDAISMADNGAHLSEEDPAAAFLAQQECEIAGIENDTDGFGVLEEAETPPPSEEQPVNYDVPATVNGDLFEESNGPTDSYAAIAQVDIQRQEPESLRKWREEQKTRLEALDSASKAAEAEWRAKAKKELEDWHTHQSDQMEEKQTSEEVFTAECEDNSPGSEWDRVARLCDFNPKTNKQAKDVSRMRSVLISLKQAPLVR
uniref:Clathrin light chain n=1 Tax=Gouania willdenowi TaxID=441366 RepID=A0A8C5GJ89_GOUWI